MTSIWVKSWRKWESDWKYTGEKCFKEIRSVKDLNEKYVWCVKIRKKLNGARVEWVGRRTVKNNVRKVVGKLVYDKDIDFYFKWGCIRGFWVK